MADRVGHVWVTLSIIIAFQFQRSALAQHLRTYPMSSSRSMRQHWLMKAEPDPRVVKGKDVKVHTCALT